MTQERRFEFGKNWQNFLKLIDEERIQVATESLQSLLKLETLSGKTFLDVGCGSGLFSLAARRLGAEVHSFDFDPQSVACTEELRSRFGTGTSWKIEQGSILDQSFLATLQKHDIVYSWGVLHHTGRMWEAIDNASCLVKDQGRFCLAIYNDQGGASRRWLAIKKLYNHSPAPIGTLLVFGVAAIHLLRSTLIRLIRFQNPLPFREWKQRKQQRGMSLWHDIVDWVGGYPFEVAKPEEVFDFLTEKSFRLVYLKTQGCGYGCNELTFAREEAPTRQAEKLDHTQHA